MCIKMLNFYSLMLYLCIYSDWEKLCVVEGVSKEIVEGAARIKVFTVATTRNDAYLRYLKSAQDHGISDITTIGLDQVWKGGNLVEMSGGGQKINLLREAVAKYQHENDTIILFTDSYDVIFLAGLEEIYRKFITTGARVLFGAEKNLWPKENLDALFPPTRNRNASRYLNSGCYMGYAPEIHAMLQGYIKDADDDQLYFAEIFLQVELREKYGIKLDTESKIFQNLAGLEFFEALRVRFDLGAPHARLENLYCHTQPSIVHANGQSKVFLNTLDGFLLNPKQLEKERYEKVPLDENNLPTVLLKIVIKKSVPFFDLFLKKIEALEYPKEKMDVLIISTIPYHDDMSAAFAKRLTNEYHSIEPILSDKLHREDYSDFKTLFKAKANDYLLVIEADAHIDDPALLRELLKAKKKFIAPLLDAPANHPRVKDYIAITKCPDITQILERKFVGVWNVAFATSVYLVEKSIVERSYSFRPVIDESIRMVLEKEHIFMYLDNRHVYGHLVATEGLKINDIHPDFHMLFNNERDWIDKYLHPDYGKLLETNDNIIEVCPDVFYMPFVSKAFCNDMIDIMNSRGRFTSKGLKDKSDLAFDPVPTVDIHTTEVGLHEFWLRFLSRFVNPLQEKLFMGYISRPPRCNKAFMVRYTPDEQSYLRPHFDFSIYTINIAMNQAGVDFEGGGCRFIRYNCSVTETKTGWAILHPSQLTYMHEGLPVTNGTRYIMVSFNDDS